MELLLAGENVLALAVTQNKVRHVDIAGGCVICCTGKIIGDPHAHWVQPESGTAKFLTTTREGAKTLRTVNTSGHILSGPEYLTVFDGLTGKGIRSRYAEEAERRTHVGKFYYQPPSGESWCDVALRVRCAGVALSLVAGALPGPLAEEFGAIHHRLSLGADPVMVWREVGRHEQLAPLGRAMVRAHESGAAVGSAISALAEELRDRARFDVESRARSVDVKSAGRAKSEDDIYFGSELGFYALLRTRETGDPVRHVGYLTWLRLKRPMWQPLVVPVTDDLLAEAMTRARR